MNAKQFLKPNTVLVMVALFMVLGCYKTAVDTSEFARGPAPLRMPSPGRETDASCSYEDSLTGGQVFSMYCGYCHNARSLAERPFASYRNAAAHMRVVVNLTGKEHAKLMEFLRRWHDVPPPHPDLEPSPKRFFFSQPIPELRPQEPAMDKPMEPAAPPQPQPQGAAAAAEEPHAK
jgi:hypothetical protein